MRSLVNKGGRTYDIAQRVILLLFSPLTFQMVLCAAVENVMRCFPKHLFTFGLSCFAKTLNNVSAYLKYLVPIYE